MVKIKSAKHCAEQSKGYIFETENGQKFIEIWYSSSRGEHDEMTDDTMKEVWPDLYSGTKPFYFYSINDDADLLISDQPIPEELRKLEPSDPFWFNVIRIAEGRETQE